MPRLLVSADLLTAVLAWCSGHPHPGPLPAFEPLTMRRHADGSVTVEGDAPDVIAFSADLLETADPRYLSFNNGVLAMDALPEPLRYRPLGPDPASFTVVFQRVEEA